ncbi:MAG TPA: cation:proton antiporter [Terriglobia bacterium]|nr:cation:proton antiporter [Terriglobia bacterium]
MSSAFLFALLGGLVVLAFAANRLFRLTRVPDVIVLMATGLLLGPTFGLVHASQFQPVTHAFGTLAVILILFEGGLDLDLRSTLRHFPGGILLSFLAYAFSLFIIALVMRWSMNMPLPMALITGAVLACTSSSITLPVLQQIKASASARVTMLLDASLSDTFAILTVGVVLDLGSRSGQVALRFLGQAVFVVLTALILAGFAAVVWTYLLPRLSERRFWNVLTLSAVLLLYAGAERIGVSGLITVLCFGVFLANFRRLDLSVLEGVLGFKPVGDEHHAQVVSFHAELAFLIRTFFFVLLGVVVEYSALVKYIPQVLGLIGAIILARALAVGASSWSWKGFQPGEHEVVFLIMPRGLITVVLALQVVQARGDAFSFLPPVAFATILITNLMLILGTIRAARLAVPPGEAKPEHDKSTSQAIVN